VEEYISKLSDESRPVFLNLRNTIVNNLTAGFVERMNYGMVGFIIPYKLYLIGYQCNPKLSLPFIAIAAQKNHRYIPCEHL
jgi:hypothetical protein